MRKYEKPEVEVIEVEIESGFALSSIGYSNDELDLDGDAL